jgi:hypothetical protein
MISAHLIRQTGNLLRLQEPRKILKLPGCQAKLDQSVSVDPQMSAPDNKGFAIFGIANDIFDDIAAGQ